MRLPARSTRHLLAVALVVMALVSGCGSGPVRFGRDDVADPDALLAALDSHFRSDVATESVTTVEDSRCYLSRTRGAQTIEATAYCGPVRRTGSSGPAVWDTYALAPAPAPGRRVALAVVSRTDTSVALPDGLGLFRPDGRRPPDDSAKLTPPPPPAATSGQVSVIDGPPPATGAAPEAGADAVVITPALSVVLTGTSTTDTTTLESGPARAADGEEFVVATLEVAGGPAYPDPNADLPAALRADVTPTTAVVSGDRRSAVALVPESGGLGSDSPASWDATAGRAALEGNATVRTVVAAVPKGAPVALGLAVAGSEQTIDLRTGRRTSEVSTAYYRPTLVAPVAAAYPTRTQTIGDFEARLGGYVDKAYLTSFDVRAGWAPAGRAFVVIPLQDVPDLASGLGGYTYRPDSTRTALLTVGADTYRPRDNAGAAPSLTFEVPDSVTAGTFVYRPTGRFSADSQFLKPSGGAFRAATALTIPLTF